MKDNDLASIAIVPMSPRHYEIVGKELIGERFPKVVEQAVRAVFVDQVEPTVACSQFALVPHDLAAALNAYARTWDKYCEDNELVTGVFWLPPEIAECVKTIESRTLNRIQRRRKGAATRSRSPTGPNKS